MTFHIIYTPNSVEYLSFFIYSLLEHSPYHFCLVSNGCSMKERAVLEKMSEQNSRLSYCCFPTDKMQSHGIVLDYLQVKNTEEYFCFMDSDIFFTGPIFELENMMRKENLCGLFSGMPLWVKKSEETLNLNFREMIGTFNQIENGICIGSSYFAVYKNESLNQIMQHYGIGFKGCLRNDLPFELQIMLDKFGYFQTFFDTGKLINVLLNRHKFALRNIALDTLCHIGGTSYETTYRSMGRTKGQRLTKLLSPFMLKPLLLKVKKIIQQRRMVARYKNAPIEEYAINYNQRILHRNLVRKHFLDLYVSLSRNLDIHDPPQFRDSEITTNLREAHDVYVLAFQKYNCFTQLT